MTFYRLNEIPSRNDELLCKASTTVAFLWPIVYWGISIAFLLRGIKGGVIYGLKMSTGLFCYGGAAVFGLLGKLAFGNFRARTQPTNWLMRCNSSGVLIKYRSFENWRFPVEDVQVVGLNYSEITEIRVAQETRQCSSLSGRNYDKDFTYLDFYLANADTSALEAYLAAEQNEEGPITIKTKWLEARRGKWWDYPVEVLPGGIVRVRWNESDGYRNTPSLSKVIAYLRRYVKTTASGSKKVDLTVSSKLSPEEADSRIYKLAHSGDKMAAVKMTREIYGCSLSEAVAYVEDLQSKRPAPAIKSAPGEEKPSPVDRKLEERGIN